MIVRNITEGERLKQEALANLTARRAATVRQGQRGMLFKLLADGECTADDVRDSIDIPQGLNPTCLGAVPGPLARAGIIESMGYEKSCRPEAHARIISRWGLRDSAKARLWLAENPPMKNPALDDTGLQSQTNLF